MKKIVFLLAVIFSIISLAEEKKDLKFKIQNNSLNNVTIFIQDSSKNIKKEKYIIKKGDTLSEIARKYKTTIKKIAMTNNIKNINLIQPNIILIIE